MGRQSTWQLMVPIEEAKKRIIKWESKGDSWDYEKRPGYIPKFPTKKNRPEVLPEPEITPAATWAELRSISIDEPPVTIAKTEKEETRAIAGPEPEKTFAALASLRKDEPMALIEAARQYASRQSAVEKEYQSLVTMGLRVDKDMFLKSIELPKDEFLEAISFVLPLVTSLQNQNDYLLDQLNHARDKIKDYAEVKHSYERLQKRWNERVAEKVMNG
jgi:type I site-specific restriction-modification system R (restriction) subunit